MVLMIQPLLLRKMTLPSDEPFLKRNKAKTYKLDSLGEIHSPNELTIKYPFAKKDANSLVRFIWLLHERKGLTPQLPFSAYVVHIKSLLKELTADEIIPLILKAGEVSNHPFTIKFLKTLHEKRGLNEKN